ncbi:MAG: hypothetical protein LJE70_13305 [Chromatiaceae bacterium]|jgi:hypothetical protein|nr:hypothetical protein [Chromatiaceae bacterium]
MKTKLIITMLAGIFTGTGLAAEAVDPYALEPCMNGAVSASGLYATQAEEDTALAEAKRLEQTTNGQVSQTGR